MTSLSREPETKSYILGALQFTNRLLLFQLLQFLAILLAHFAKHVFRGGFLMKRQRFFIERNTGTHTFHETPSPISTNFLLLLYGWLMSVWCVRSYLSVGYIFALFFRNFVYIWSGLKKNWRICCARWQIVLWDSFHPEKVLLLSFFVTMQ